MARPIIFGSAPRARRRGNPSDRVFHEEGLTHGLAYASDGQARAGMGIAAGDIYGDGGEAVIVTNLPTESFTVFQRQPNGEFVDATEQSGISPISLPYSGFGVGLFDMENRGLLDLFSANGAVAAMATEQGEKFPYRQRNLLLRNRGKGKGFEDITASAGPALQPVEVSRAAVFGDVNNDGGMDILVTTNNGPAHLLLNTVPDRGHWIWFIWRESAPTVPDTEAWWSWCARAAQSPAHPSDAMRGAMAVISPPTIPEYISVWGKTPRWIASRSIGWPGNARRGSRRRWIGL